MSPKKKPKPRSRKAPPRPLPEGTKDKGGRPQGSLKRFPFHQTPLGFMLRYETPLVYSILMALCPQHRRNCPRVEVVEAVCAASGDPAFRKPKFRRYLERYAREGVFCRRGKRLTPERARYYERLRRCRLDNYILEHWEEIQWRRRKPEEDEQEQ